MKKIFIFLIFSTLFGSCGSDNGGSFRLGDGSGVSKTGSFSSYTIVDDFLYIVKNNILTTINIASENPVKGQVDQLNAEAETLFKYENYLLIGTQTGVLVYDISIRQSPTYVSNYTHQTGCDPVIARDDIAYITIRNEFSCNTQFDSNLLIVVDISDISIPLEVEQIDMTSPRGLTIIGNKLLVGQGEFGLVQFNISDPKSPLLEKRYPSIDVNDMITLDSLVLMINDLEIMQYQLKADSLIFVSRL